MSYRRSPRCGYCYAKGHNRTTCPDLKKRAEEEPNSYYGRQWARMQAAKKERSGTKRKCSWCSETGHNRKTCQKLADDRAEIIAAELTWRRAFVRFMKDNVPGIGSLIENGDKSYLAPEDSSGYRSFLWPGDEGHVAPRGLVTNVSFHSHSDLHYSKTLTTSCSLPASMRVSYFGNLQFSRYSRRNEAGEHEYIPDNLVPNGIMGFKYWRRDYGTDTYTLHDTRRSEPKFTSLSHVPFDGDKVAREFLSFETIMDAVDRDFDPKRPKSERANSDSICRMDPVLLEKLREYADGETDELVYTPAKPTY